MGALDEGHLDAELENRVKLGFLELGLGDDSETAVIEDAVKVLLQGLGEDPNREGLRKTPLRVAKAFREGTTGEYISEDFYCLLKSLVSCFGFCCSSFIWYYCLCTFRKMRIGCLVALS